MILTKRMELLFIILNEIDSDAVAYLKTHTTKKATSISEAFTWWETPQEHDYWQALSNKTETIMELLKL